MPDKPTWTPGPWSIDRTVQERDGPTMIKLSPESNLCEHCWHAFYGAYMQVLHSGEIIQECCKCHAHRTIHREHAHEKHGRAS
jgi:hypothetical protein